MPTLVVVLLRVSKDIYRSLYTYTPLRGMNLCVPYNPFLWRYLGIQGEHSIPSWDVPPTAGTT